MQRRIELGTQFNRFLEQADKLDDQFKQVETILKSAPEETKLQQFNNHWAQIKPAYAQLKVDGNRFLSEAGKVM